MVVEGGNNNERLFLGREWVDMYVIWLLEYISYAFLTLIHQRNTTKHGVVVFNFDFILLWMKINKKCITKSRAHIHPHSIQRSTTQYTNKWRKFTWNYLRIVLSSIKIIKSLVVIVLTTRWFENAMIEWFELYSLYLSVE